MEAPAPTSTPTDPPPSSTSSDLLPPLPSTDPPPIVPLTEPPSSPVSSAAPSTNPSSIASEIQSQSQSQTLEPQQQQQQPQPQQSQPQSQPQPPQQRPPPAIPRPRPPTQSITRGGGGGGGGMALGVPAGYSHHQRPQSVGPYSSFRPSNPFGAPPPSFVQPFAGMPRTSAGGPEHSSSSNAQARPPIPCVQTIGMIGSLSTAPAASQMRPGGVPAQNQQRLGQSQVSSASPSTNQVLNSQVQRFPSHLGPRAPSLTSPSSQSPGPQSSQSLQQQWLSAQGKQTHAASLPSSSYRPQMRPPTMQQRPQPPQQLQQQHQLPITSHLQVSAPQQQQLQKQHQLRQLQQMQQQQQQQQSSLPNQSQEHNPLRNQQSIPPQHQTARGFVPTTGKSNVQAVVHPGLATSTNYNDPDELSNDIISRKRIGELVAQVDWSEKLRPEIEDDLLEIADDFIENIVTAACHLAKHRKSTTLEAKDILLHVERHWNMTLPGFSGDEIKCYKKPSTNDIHKERLAMIKKSMVGTNEGGNAKTLASSVGQAAANPKLHAAKTPAMGSPKAREPT